MTAQVHSRRDEIVTAMLAMAGEQGVDRVTTRALARRLGVTEPVLYRHFAGGKAEMWRALAATVRERMLACWRRALGGSEGGALERIRALVHAQLQLIATTPALPAILFSRTLHRDNADLRAGIAEIGVRFHAYLEQIVAQGQHDGEMRPHPPAPDMAWLLISVVQGTAIRWSLSERGFDLEQEGGRVLEAALVGLAADPAPAAPSVRSRSRQRS